MHQGCNACRDMNSQDRRMTLASRLFMGLIMSTLSLTFRVTLNIPTTIPCQVFVSQRHKSSFISHIGQTRSYVDEIMCRLNSNLLTNVSST